MTVCVFVCLYVDRGDIVFELANARVQMLHPSVRLSNWDDCISWNDLDLPMASIDMY